mmetsp:Transcript_26549/g.48166  ORF Transcript_26549/g.48166 Transcript_26549/m.48166 type:complete len:885 (-) Transcript_26549:148-2802(-)|eukprot:CAMPEP_0198306364 /NCGR_PEP_ID=MMETSP1449-20131203/58377_1 /TAXON_ID=420275 /ORGANISM="Attheya septentrionalis, Strain CCMP2084" /LENGTH=884 /DNA_ID=CAMNT_0044008917 /DNA_START=1220 /DNA_END=3874 /DNA_ORIENTATION=-
MEYRPDAPHDPRELQQHRMTSGGELAPHGSSGYYYSYSSQERTPLFHSASANHRLVPSVSYPLQHHHEQQVQQRPQQYGVTYPQTQGHFTPMQPPAYQTRNHPPAILTVDPNVHDETTGTTTAAGLYVSPNETQDTSHEDEVTTKRHDKEDTTEKRRRTTPWEVRYEELVQFQAEHGNVLVPQLYPPHPALGRWCSKQREYYRQQSEDEVTTTPLTLERIQLLQTLGFSFAPGRGGRSRTPRVQEKLDQEWETRFAELLQYRETHGHVDVPIRYKETGALGRWVAVQRRSYQQRVTTGVLRSSVSAKTNDGERLKRRFERLSEIGFQFVLGHGNNPKTPKRQALSKQQAEKWELLFRQWVQFHQDHSQEVPSSELARWIIEQRRRYWYRFKQAQHSNVTMNKYPRRTESNPNQKGNNETKKKKSIELPLEEEKVKRLEQVGFSWNPARDALFEGQLTTLRRYFGQHGNSLQDFRRKDNPKLYKWMEKQRAYFRDYMNGHISKLPKRLDMNDRIRRLEAVGFTWNYKAPLPKRQSNKESSSSKVTRHDDSPSFITEKASVTCEATVNKMNYSTVVHAEPVAENKATEPATVDVDHKVAKETDGTVAHASSQSHMKLMEEESSLKGSKWMKPEAWMRRFQELVEFKSIHGHCRVPGRMKPLGGWVKIQREDYKKRQDQKVSPMSNSRIKRLEEIGFEWRVLDPSHLNQWDDRFQQLVEYQKSHNGSVDVPQTYKANPTLGKWCSKQREFYRLLKLGKKSQIMTQERIDKLNSIGFHWVIGRGKKCRNWDASFQEILKYKETYGHCNVPSQYTEDRALATWAKMQRETFADYGEDSSSRKTSVKDKRYQKLQDIGFHFYSGKDTKKEESPLSSSRKKRKVVEESART